MARTRRPTTSSVRDRIMAFLEREPGASIAEVASAAGVHPSTASYHVQVMERTARVHTVRAGRVRAVYPRGEVPCLVARRLKPRLERPAVRRAVEDLVRRGRTSLRSLRARGFSESEARWAVRVLTEAQVGHRLAGGLVFLDGQHRPCLAELVDLDAPAPDPHAEPFMCGAR